MNGITPTQTQQWIMDALLLLMNHTHYREITIVDIVTQAHIGRRTFYRYFKNKDDVLLLHCQIILQDFAMNIRGKEKLTLYSVSLSYFEFWQRQLDFLELLRKCNMLHFVGERLFDFLVQVALWVEHVSPEQVGAALAKQDKYYYAHYFNIGGYWSLTTLWLNQSPRKSPEEMATILVDIIDRQL